MKHIGWMVMVLGGIALALWQPFGKEGDRAPQQDRFSVPSDGHVAPRPLSVMIPVSIGGGVLRPGRYEVPLGSRTSDVVAMAGGFLVGANTTRVKLASTLKEGEHIVVPMQPNHASLPKGRNGKKGTPSKKHSHKPEQNHLLPLFIQAGLNGGDPDDLHTRWRLSRADVNCIVTHRKKETLRTEATLRQAGVSALGIRRLLSMTEKG